MMRGAKKIFIKDIQDGQPVNGLFLVKESSKAETKSGKPFLILTLMDRTGEMGARLWENADQLQAEAPTGGFITIAGQAQAFRGVVQLKIDTLAAVSKEDVDITEFLPATDLDFPAMTAELNAAVKGIGDPFLKKLLAAFFTPGAFFDSFQKAPAAKSVHHAYIGGLMEHTLAVARLANAIAALYPGIDRDLFITGALLHDVAKVEEFSYESFPFSYTDRGRLVGHLVLGAEMVRERAGKIKNFPEDLLVRVQHLILSHHGQHEFGSPTLPMMTEALLLNMIDDMDAKLNYIGRIEENLPVSDSSYQWSEYQRILDRFLYLRGRGGAEEARAVVEEEPPKPRESKQQTLFSL